MAAVQPYFRKIIDKNYLNKFKNDNRLYPVLATRRPNFGPNQVRCQHELKRGLTYLEVHGGPNDYSELFVVVSDPFYKNGDLVITIRYVDTGYVTDAYLSDQGIVPHNTPLRNAPIVWNSWNHAAFTDGSRHMKGCCLCDKRGRS